jgi:1-acyl-sn-glycerol-3-phosphate acyltransferase
MFRKIIQPFYTGYVILIFLATLFLVLPFYLILSLPNNYHSRKAIWALTLLWSKVWLRLTGMSINKIEGSLPKIEKVVIIANHISYLDPIIIYDVIPFYFRPLAKHEIKKVPIFGFVYAQIALLVDRSNTQSRAKSMRKMQDALQNDCSIFLYPEGTFNETEEPLKSFFDGAFKLAIEAQVPILPIVFPDSKSRWHYDAWWKMWPGKNRAFILEVIQVNNLNLESLPQLKEMVKELMANKIKEVSN